MGKQRLGINLISLIAVLREEARLPFRVIQWYLDTVHGLRLSVGAIVAATPRVAQKAQSALTDIVERIRGSPVVHADETGWREDGHNGCVWTFSTPTERYFLRRNRGKAVVDEALGDQFAGVLVSDFYAAYHHYDGPKQRCWATPVRARGRLCCGTSTTCGHSTPQTAAWRGGPMPSTMSTKRPKPSPIRQNSAGALPDWPWNAVCWPGAVPTLTTRRQPRPDCAAASRNTSRNASSSWPNRRCQRTTTPPNAVGDTW